MKMIVNHTEMFFVSASVSFHGGCDSLTGTCRRNPSPLSTSSHRYICTHTALVSTYLNQNSLCDLCLSNVLFHTKITFCTAPKLGLVSKPIPRPK